MEMSSDKTSGTFFAHGEDLGTGTRHPPEVGDGRPNQHCGQQRLAHKSPSCPARGGSRVTADRADPTNAYRGTSCAQQGPRRAMGVDGRGVRLFCGGPCSWGRWIVERQTMCCLAVPSKVSAIMSDIVTAQSESKRQMSIQARALGTGKQTKTCLVSGGWSGRPSHDSFYEANGWLPSSSSGCRAERYQSPDRESVSKILCESSRGGWLRSLRPTAYSIYASRQSFPKQGRRPYCDWDNAREGRIKARIGAWRHIS